jgi:hypothetical protein
MEVSRHVFARATLPFMEMIVCIRDCIGMRAVMDIETAYRVSNSGLPFRIPSLFLLSCHSSERNPSIYLLICMPTCLPVCLSTLAVYLSTCLSIYDHLYLSIHSFIHPILCLTIYLPTYIPAFPCICYTQSSQFSSRSSTRLSAQSNLM